ncbi:MAG TPA: DUF1549 domain-containing protein [Kofleriaceae bacterium]|nr:DUF1549 domain-containing protein [Kofleriaceae bacterium]
MSPRRPVLALGLTLGALAVAACDDGGTSTVTPPPEPPPPPSQNVIDVAIWPRMIADGLTNLTPASPEELCRRMSLDLTGRTPTADEVAADCTGKSAADMARAFMATPRFRDVERRFWIRRVGADAYMVYGEHLVDADRLYDQLATGALGYDDFAAKLLAHPVMTINRPVAAGDDVTLTVTNIFKVFLGRAPVIAEISDYANLLRPWRRVAEMRMGGTPDLGYTDTVWPAALDPMACQDQVLGVAGCTSTLLGATTVVNPIVSPQAPPGYTTDPALFYYETVQGAMPTALETELEKPGRLLATRDEFWDEAVDFPMRRFLGWWRSTPNEPDSVLPEVQLALSAWFRATPDHDLRELYVMVLSSLLYTTSIDVAPNAPERAPWGTGPMKTLEPEQLLDSVSVALQRPLGLCDPHTSQPVDPMAGGVWPPRLRTPQPDDWYGFGRDFYRETASDMGGCLGALPTPRQPGLRALFTHIAIADQLCSAPSKVLPDGLTADDTTPAAVDALADHLFRGFLARTPTDDERAAVHTAADACFADAGCHDLAGLAHETCGALLRSAAFLYY